MQLYINTSNSEKILVGFDNKRIEVDSRQGKSQQLLEVIAKELRRRGKGFADIEEIDVNLGPGSFTGLRVGVSVANTLGWALGVQVNGKPQLVEPSY